MALGDETSRGVDDHLAVVGDVALADHLVCFSGLAQFKGVDGDHLVGREAVVQFAHLDILHINTSLGGGSSAGLAGHAKTHQVNRAAVVECGVVGSQLLAGNLDCLVLEVGASIQESLGDDDGSSTSV